jgi:site-specific DNA-methyltransferase (adenine-specific)
MTGFKVKTRSNESPRLPTARQKGSALPTLEVATEFGALYHGDCMDVIRRIKDNSIDCVFADPPFNLGKNYGSLVVADSKPESQYFEWMKGWISECVRVLKPGGTLFVYHIPRWLIPLGAYLNNCDEMEFRHWIAIKMKNGFPIRHRLHPAHYGLLYYVKRGRKFRFNVCRHPSPQCRHCGELIRDYGGYKKKYKTDHNDIPLIQLADVWDDVSPNIHRKNRPRAVNELPSVVPERAILMATRKNDLLLDPFVGGGISLGIAERNGRYWIGCELGTTANAIARIVDEPAASIRRDAPERVQRVFTSPKQSANRIRFAATSNGNRLSR